MCARKAACFCFIFRFMCFCLLPRGTAPCPLRSCCCSHLPSIDCHAFLCLPSPARLFPCSMGSYGDSSFEESIFKLYGTKTHTFDPFLTQDKQELMMKLPCVYFHNYGLGTKTEKVTDEGTRITGLVKDIHSIMAELGHSFIDLFKVCHRASRKGCLSRGAPLQAQSRSVRRTCGRP